MVGELVNVVCVLTGAWPQTAPALGEDYVLNLHDGICKHLHAEFKFTCFTDRASEKLPGIDTRSLPAGLHGWFNKLYLFSKDAFPEGSRVLYFDLDTVLLGDLELLATVDITKPVFLWDENHPLTKRAASGIMAFRSGPELYPIWDEFESAGYARRPPPYGMSRNIKHPMLGDSVWQQWIDKTAQRGGITTDEEWLHYFIYPAKHRLWQDVLKERTLLSYKWDVMGLGRSRKKREHAPWTALCFFHGRPRPHEVKGFWYARPRIAS